MAEQQLADAMALGLDVDPPVVVQSERTAAYADAMAALRDEVYPCFCTRREIAEASSAPHGRPRRYPGTCRDLGAAERAARARLRDPAWRIRADDVEVTVTDVLHGPVRGRPDDVVLRRADGSYAYHLAVVTDDGAAGVDQVVRGDDLLAAAIDQAWLATRLGLPVPTYAHVPLAVNGAGQRLAKRDGAVTRRDLAAQGIDDRALLGLLTDSLGLAGSTPGELLAGFDPARLPREPWVVHQAWVHR